MPEHYFSDQKPYENVRLITHRHPILLLGEIAIFALLALIPLVLEFLLLGFTPISPDLLDLAHFGYSLFYLVWIYGLFYRLTQYLLNISIVTDHRIIDIKQRGLFNRVIAETRLINIQDITVKIEGTLQTFFNYGDVIIQTSAAEIEFYFIQVPDPNGIKDLILKLYDEFKGVHTNGQEVHEMNPLNDITPSSPDPNP